MAETNNKEKTLAGIIYHDIKAYIKEKKEIRQRKKAENRKIKFREVFIEKCKKGFHSILAKYYARKEVKIIKQNAELEDVINKKLEHMQKYEEKEAAVNEMEQIRAEQKAAKEAEKAEKMAAKEEATSVVEEETVKEEVTPVAEEPKKEEVAPVAEEPKKEETAVAVVYPNPYEMVNNNQAVEETKITEAEPVVNEQTVEIEIPVPVEPVQIVEETKITETEPVVNEQTVEAEIPVTVEPVQVVEEPMVESVSVEDEMAKVIQSSSPVEEKVENTQVMDAEEQAKLAGNVQAILNEEQVIEKENSNKNDLDLLNETAELGAAVAQLQEKVAVSLASKQRELDEVKEENKQLVNEVAKAKEEAETNERIHNDVVALKDQEINNRDQEIAALRQQLEQERMARVQAENQFRNLASAIQSVQAMGTEQPQVEAVQEESFQKRI